MGCEVVRKREMQRIVSEACAGENKPIFFLGAHESSPFSKRDSIVYYLHCTSGPSHSLADLLWSCWNGMGDALSITDDETTLTHCSPKVVALKSDKILFFFFNT